MCGNSRRKTTEVDREDNKEAQEKSREALEFGDREKKLGELLGRMLTGKRLRTLSKETGTCYVQGNGTL